MGEFMIDEIMTTIAKQIANEMLKQPKRIIQPDEPLISSGLIDSFHLVDLALFIEDTYGVVVADSELTANTFDNLKQLTTLVESRLKA
jgi:acyl carrier protein